MVQIGRRKGTRGTRSAWLSGRFALIVVSMLGLAAGALVLPSDSVAQLGLLAGVRLQSATPGTADVGHANITGTLVSGELRTSYLVSGSQIFATSLASNGNPLFVSHSGSGSTGIYIQSFSGSSGTATSLDILQHGGDALGAKITCSPGVSPSSARGLVVEMNNYSFPGANNTAIDVSSSGQGIRSVASGSNKSAVYGTATNGTLSSCAGVHGEGTSFNGNGVVARATNGDSAYALWAITSTGYGVYCSGRLTATGTKAFQIDHPLDPENQLLNHYCAEGPEPMNAYSGNVVTDAQGTAWVTLPDYFEEINRDFRYQLTPIGQFAQAIVAQEIRGNRFQIRTDKPRVKVSWRVEAVRNDRWVREYGAPIEVEKQGKYAGKYLNPELFGQPEERGMAFSGQPTSAKTP